VLKVVLKSRYALFSNMSRRMAGREEGEGGARLGLAKAVSPAVAAAQKA
jgi:hypothetical protein